jgi:hypothetical protein
VSVFATFSGALHRLWLGLMPAIAIAAVQFEPSGFEKTWPLVLLAEIPVMLVFGIICWAIYWRRCTGRLFE